MRLLYQAIKPLLFRLDAEQAHYFITKILNTITALPKIDFVLQNMLKTYPELQTTVCGIDFPNPVGLAAGFDKNGHYLNSMSKLGFGFMELGTVTPQPQQGNPQPRLFRLTEDQALINRMGFNNLGHAALREQLHGFQHQRTMPLGINLGKNKTTPNETAYQDYTRGILSLGPYADYLVVNISSPNTPGLRSLSQREPLHNLLSAVQAARQTLTTMTNQPAPPLWLKISPDERLDDLDTILHVAQAVAIDGIIATNTTVARTGLYARNAQESGGLSGAPLTERANHVIAYIYQATKGRLPLMGVGGIGSGEQAYIRICAGASLLQLYTGLIYQGPSLVQEIQTYLVSALKRDGYTSLAQATGSRAADYC